MRILGLSAYYHDSAAALLIDGKPVAAAQEERFTRRKHDPRFPEHAIRYCLEEAGIGLDDVDHIVFYEKPLLKFERLLETYLANAPRGYQSFRMAIPVWIKEKLFQKSNLAAALKKISAVRQGDRGEAAVRRAPPEPRRIRVLSLPVRRGRRADDGRRRRMGDDVGRDRPRLVARDRQGDPLAAQPRPALLRVHLLHRLPRQLRRVQGDGPRALRRAEVRRPDPRTT